MPGAPATISSISVEIVGDAVVQEGGNLHSSVDPRRWCVTRADLQHFRSEVARAVREGQIVPTPNDNFDAQDTRIGPSIHTVNEQLIKPVTARCGNVSWALMRHPEGLECDLFITHCWSEGIYEFVDKVLHCWPRGARHAYCCMLSNPQNLDISGLIQSPRSSPFAQALESARYMLVVPNSKMSIYTRIWCIYEAYLAYSWDKFIFTATAPVDGFRTRMLVMTFIFAACTSMVFTAYLRDLVELREFMLQPPAFFALLTTAASMLFLSLLAPSSRIHAVVNYIGIGAWGLFVGLGLWTSIESIDGNPEALDYEAMGDVEGWAIMGVGYAFAVAALEADRLWYREVKEEAAELQQGYTGKLRDAMASRLEDKACILGEIGASGSEEDVDHAIAVLIDAGMSTPSLREAAVSGANVRGAGFWNLGEVIVVVMIWLFQPASHAYQDISCGGLGRVIPLLRFLEGLAWTVLFVSLGPDQKGLAAMAGGKLATAPYIAAWCLWACTSAVRGDCCERLHCHPDILGTTVLGPLMLIISAGGIARVARIPVLGPWIVNLLLKKGMKGSASTALHSDKKRRCLSENSELSTDA